MSVNNKSATIFLMKHVTVFLGVVLTVVAGQSCVTPNGGTATCISLLKCPTLLQPIQDQDYSTHKFIEASTCPQGRLTVCCGVSSNFVSTEPSVSSSQSRLSPQEYVLKNILPSKRVCGLQHTDDYFYNDTDTSVDEFPWLVYFVKQEDYVNSFYLKKESNCVGVLINNRYVLTLYHECISKAQPQGGLNHTIEMLFGQHHIYKNVSCIPTKFGIEDCSLPVIREVSYLWLQRHYQTDKSHPSRVLTVSLVRLNKSLSYTDYIRPICLPFKEDNYPRVDDTIVTSGWGEPTYVNGKNVKLKKRVKYALMSDEECETGNELDNPICGVPLEDNSNVVCPGDNGGPLMYKRKNSWFVIGLLSVPSCGDIRPVTAEKLTPTIVDWIITKIAEIEGLL